MTLEEAKKEHTNRQQHRNAGPFGVIASMQ
jgi:hypothetical protein